MERAAMQANAVAGWLAIAGPFQPKLRVTHRSLACIVVLTL